MQRGEREAAGVGIEAEHAAARDQRLRRAAAKHAGGGEAGGRDVLDPLHQHPARVLLAEQDGARRHQVHERRAEAAGKAHAGSRPVAGADQVDVGLPVDLAAAEEKQVDAALAGEIEQLARAVGERVAAAAVQQR